jgi:hypothetical protein
MNFLSNRSQGRFMPNLAIRRWAVSAGIVSFHRLNRKKFSLKGWLKFGWLKSACWVAGSN